MSKKNAQLIPISKHALDTLQKRSLELASTARTSLQKQQRSPFWDVRYLEQKIKKFGFENVLKELQLRSFDPDILPLYRALLRLGHLIRRPHGVENFLVLWRDECFQQGWTMSVSQADSLLAQRNHSHIRRVHYQTVPSCWRINIEHPTKVLLGCVMGDTTVVTTTTQNIYIWSRQTGQRLQTIEYTARRISVIALDITERYLAMGTTDGDAIVWDLQTGQPAKIIPCNGCSLIQFDEDGQRLAVANWEGAVSLWAMRDHNGIWLHEKLPDIPSAMAFGYDGESLIIGLENGQLVIWNLFTSTQTIRHSPNDSAITAICTHINNQKMGVGYANGECWIWNIRNLEEPYLFSDMEEPIEQLSFRYNELVGASATGRICTWSLDNGSLLFDWETEQQDTQHVALAEDELSWALVLPDGTVQLWEKDQTKYREGHDLAPISSVFIAPTGRKITLGRKDGIFQIWDGISGHLIDQYPEQEAPIGDTFLPNDKEVWVGLQNGMFQRWSLKTGEKIQQIQLTAQWIDQFHFYNRGILTTQWDGSIQCWTPTGTLRHNLHIDKTRITSVATDKNYIAAGSWSGTFRVWDNQTGEVIVTNKDVSVPITAIALGNNPNEFVIGKQDGSMGVFHIHNGWKWTRKVDGNVLSIARSPDGKYLISGTDNRNIHLWSASIGAHLASFYLPHEPNTVRFGQGWRIIVAAHDQVHFLQWVCVEPHLS